MSLSQFVDHHQNDAMFHSSAYAKVAHGDKIGSTNTQSFNQRIQLERGRKAVRRYGDSLIGSGYMKEATDQRLSARTAAGRNIPRLGSRPTVGSRTSRPTAMRPAMPARHFTEPRSRYNPYA